MMNLETNLDYELSKVQPFFNPELRWVLSYVQPYYDKPDRFFHNFEHIKTSLAVLAEKKKNNLSIELSDEQFIAWLFHDIVYLPGSQYNEEISADLMKNFCEEYRLNIDISIAHQIIIDTTNHIPTIPQSELVLDMDMYCLGPNSYLEFIKGRARVELEYNKFYSEEETKKGVIEFLKNIQGKQIFHTQYFADNQKKFENYTALYLKRISE